LKIGVSKEGVDMKAGNEKECVTIEAKSIKR
jgi:hypothetical protein